MSAGSAARREDVGLERAKKRGGGVVLAALRQHRLRRGLTQEELAQKAGVTQNYLTKVERGVRGCNPLVAQKLAEVLGVDLRELVVGPEGEDALPEGFGPKPPSRGYGVSALYLHRAYLYYVLSKEVGTAFSALSDEDLERYCKDLSWEEVLEMLSSRKRELEFLQGELENPRLPMDVRLFFEETLREARDRDIRVLAAARSQERSEEGQERLTSAMRELL